LKLKQNLWQISQKKKKAKSLAERWVLTFEGNWKSEGEQVEQRAILCYTGENLSFVLLGIKVCLFVCFFFLSFPSRN
jgi:hypothetical protein